MDRKRTENYPSTDNADRMARSSNTTTSFFFFFIYCTARCAVELQGGQREKRLCGLYGCTVCSWERIVLARLCHLLMGKRQLFILWTGQYVIRPAALLQHNGGGGFKPKPVLRTLRIPLAS